jgi:hypothetical protein
MKIFIASVEGAVAVVGEEAGGSAARAGDEVMGTMPAVLVTAMMAFAIAFLLSMGYSMKSPQAKSRGVGSALADAF